MLVSQKMLPSFLPIILSKCESSNLINRPVLWLKYPHKVWCIISKLLLPLDLNVAEFDSSFSMKQSSLLMTFSPMQTASPNRFAVDLGSSPWSARRRGLGGPLEAWDCSAADCLQLSFPFPPALTLQHETMSSRYHNSGVFCHKTKLPISPRPLLLLADTLSSLMWKSDADMVTFPTAYQLLTELRAAWPPVAATYCWTMYFAVDACCDFHLNLLINTTSATKFSVSWSVESIQSVVV